MNNLSNSGATSGVLVRYLSFFLEGFGESRGSVQTIGEPLAPG